MFAPSGDMMRGVAYPRSLLNDGEHIVVSTRTHPKAPIVPVLILLVVVAAVLIVSDASTNGRVLLADSPRVEPVQVAEDLHELSSGDRSDDGT